MSKLLEKGKYTYSNVRRWTKKFDVLSKDKIFFPVNIGNTHWALAVVYVKRKEIVYFDSLKRDGIRYLQALARWFQEDVKDKKETDVDTTKWILRSESNAPQQRNGYDCGVFTITFADFLSDDLPLQFNQQDITENRFRFASSIMAGSLQY
jgi:sentrin-specific protease 1